MTRFLQIFLITRFSKSQDNILNLDIQNHFKQR